VEKGQFLPSLVLSVEDYNFKKKERNFTKESTTITVISAIIRT